MRCANWSRARISREGMPRRRAHACGLVSADPASSATQPRIKTLPAIPSDSRAIPSDAITTRLYLPDHAQPETGCSSAWPEHCVRDAGVAGSNPVTPISILPNLRFALVEFRSGRSTILMTAGQAARPNTITAEVMPQYLVAIHHPDGYDPTVAEDEAMDRDI